MASSKEGRLHIVESFLAVPGVEINQQSCNGFTALMWACYALRLKVVELLMKEKDIDIELKSKYVSSRILQDLIDFLMRMDETAQKLAGEEEDIISLITSRES